MDAPRENLTRSVSFQLERAADSADGLTLEGYGAVFGDPTRIDSWEGTFDEVIAPGAFTKTLKERTPVIQFDHGHHPLIGSIPIAELRSITEDSDPDLAPEGGAHVIGRIFDNWLMEPVRDAIAATAGPGLIGVTLPAVDHRHERTHDGCPE